MKLDDAIKATAHFRRGALQGVTAVVRIQVEVEVDLFADGTFALRAKSDGGTVDAETIEQTIEREFDDECLQEAYTRSLEVDFD